VRRNGRAPVSRALIGARLALRLPAPARIPRTWVVTVNHAAGVPVATVVSVLP